MVEVTYETSSLSAELKLLKEGKMYLTVRNNNNIIIMIIMRCINFSGKYWGIFGPKLSGLPTDPYC